MEALSNERSTGVKLWDDSLEVTAQRAVVPHLNLPDGNRVIVAYNISANGTLLGLVFKTLDNKWVPLQAGRSGHYVANLENHYSTRLLAVRELLWATQYMWDRIPQGALV